MRERLRSADDIRLTESAIRELCKQSPAALSVLCRVLWRGRHGRCFASVQTLAGDGVPMSQRSVSAALALLMREGFLVRTDRERTTAIYSAGPKCPAKPMNSVFVPAAVWRTCKPAQLAYWCVQSRSALEVVEAGRMVRGARGSLSKASAYRMHAALVSAGLIAVSKRLATVSKSVVGQSQKVLSNSDQIREYGENTERRNTLLCNSYSSGALSAWEGVSLSAPSQRPQEGREMSDGQRKPPGGGSVSPQAGQADGPTAAVENQLGGSLGNRMGSQRGNLVALHGGLSARPSGPTRDPSVTASAVSGELPQRTGPRSDFLQVWNELRKRAGSELCLRPTILSSGLPSGEESTIFAAFRELGAEDTHALPTVGDWIAAGGLRWLREKNQSPWRYLARNLSDCLSRAIEWDTRGRSAIGSARYSGSAAADDFDVTERVTRKMLSEVP